MTTRISGLAIAAALALAALAPPGQVSTALAATAQVFVTGYVLQGYTATGTYVHPGTCAVDPRVIPLGSYVTIQGLGTCHAEDTGGAIIGYRIDVWEPTVAQAYALTGWYTASWGTSPAPQAPASPAAQSQSPAPTPQRLPQRLARASHAIPRRAYAIRPYLYSHGNPYVHRDPPAPARHSGALRSAALISLHAQGCPADRRTTIVARGGACTIATAPARHHVQMAPALYHTLKSTGLYGGTPGTRVAGPRARAREHEAGVHSAERAYLHRRVSSSPRERGVPRGARGGSAVKSGQPAATAGAAAPLLWLLTIIMLAVVTASARQSLLTPRRNTDGSPRGPARILGVPPSPQRRPIPPRRSAHRIV